MSEAVPNTAKLPEEPAAPKAEEKTLPPKTKGERFYDVFNFTFGKVFILVLTATLGYYADQKHAPDKIVGIPNGIKKLQGWFHKAVFNNKIYPIAEKGDFAKLVGGGLVSTMILSHGGNFFAPFVRWMENSREDISNWYNKRFGTPEDVEAAHERLKDIPKQNWMDIVKGRAVAWGTMFSIIITAYTAVGKDKKTDRYWLDVYEDKFARTMAGLTKAGKEIAATPITKELTELQKANKMYRLNKVVALDIFLTTAGIVIWNAVSRFSAKKRTEQEQLAAKSAVPSEFNVGVDEHVAHTEEAQFASAHRSKITPQLGAGFAEMARQSQAEPVASVGLG